MTREETIIIIRSMMSAYPNYNPGDVSDTVDVWANLLADYEYRKISDALKKYILTNNSGFAPSIGQLTSIIADTESTAMNQEEAWSLVHRAIKNAIYHAEEEFNKLPYSCQKAVGSAFNLTEMAKMDSETVNSVEKSHFIKTYNTMIAREKENAQLPETMRTLIEQTENPFIEVKEEEKREFNSPRSWEERKNSLKRY